jgi:hypothetical protein
VVPAAGADGSPARLVGELHITIDVLRRLVAQAGIQRRSPQVPSARWRRLATDRRLTERADQRGFADLGAWLADLDTSVREQLFNVAIQQADA